MARLRIARDGQLERLFQQGAAQVRFVSSPDPVLINTAGGMAGGDKRSWDIELGQEARRRVVSEACEKVYRSISPPARVAVRLKVGRGARLDWMPRETILFDGAHLVSDFEVEAEAKTAGVLGQRRAQACRPGIDFAAQGRRLMSPGGVKKVICKAALYIHSFFY